MGPPLEEVWIPSSGGAGHKEGVLSLRSARGALSWRLLKCIDLGSLVMRRHVASLPGALPGVRAAHIKGGTDQCTKDRPCWHPIKTGSCGEENRGEARKAPMEKWSRVRVVESASFVPRIFGISTEVACE